MVISAGRKLGLNCANTKEIFSRHKKEIKIN